MIKYNMLIRLGVEDTGQAEVSNTVLTSAGVCDIHIIYTYLSTDRLPSGATDTRPHELGLGLQLA